MAWSLRWWHFIINCFMHSWLLVIFCVSTVLILHTYLFYPLGMMLFFTMPKTEVKEYESTDDLPELAVLIAAYNEEKVISDKIISVFNTTYPAGKISVYVGSDASTDRTDDLVNALQQRFARIQLIKFAGRVGKIGIVNHLHSLVKQELLILTDANVLFNENTLFELVKKFKDQRVGIVAANITKESRNEEGISRQEKKYMSLENRIKTGESNAFNLIMGAEGGCYALRNELFTPVPANFIVDDFFITLSVLNQKRFALFNPQAVCTEDVSSDAAGEYRRKVRISSGNFQNLAFFRKNLRAFFTPLGFSFWSHKVLRWFTPFLLVTSLLVSLLLIPFNPLLNALCALQIAGFLTPVIGHFRQFRIPALRFVSHFYLMNFALLEGFFKYARGIKSSVWQPVNRDV